MCVWSPLNVHVVCALYMFVYTLLQTGLLSILYHRLKLFFLCHLVLLIVSLSHSLTHSRISTTHYCLRSIHDIQVCLMSPSLKKRSQCWWYMNILSHNMTVNACTGKSCCFEAFHWRRGLRFPYSSLIWGLSHYSAFPYASLSAVHYSVPLQSVRLQKATLSLSYLPLPLSFTLHPSSLPPSLPLSPSSLLPPSLPPSPPLTGSLVIHEPLPVHHISPSTFATGLQSLQDHGAPPPSRHSGFRNCQFSFNSTVEPG